MAIFEYLIVLKTLVTLAARGGAGPDCPLSPGPSPARGEGSQAARGWDDGRRITVGHERTVLVTGGAGYIGSHACKALRAAGFTPVACDNLVYGHPWAVRWGPLERGDIADRAWLDRRGP